MLTSRSHALRDALVALAGLVIAGAIFSRRYGPLESDEWFLGLFAAILIVILASVHGASRHTVAHTGRPWIPPSNEPLRTKLRWGLSHTLRAAVAYSAFVVILALARGTTQLGRLSLLDLIAIYWILGVVGGLVLGILKPLLAWKLGAFAVGALVGYVVYGGIALALSREEAMPWWLMLIPAVIGGGGLGLVRYDAARS
jgi:hypothetical protein